MQVRIVKLLVWVIFSVVLVPISYTMDLDRYFINEFKNLESDLYSRALKKSIIDRFSAKTLPVKIHDQEYYYLSRFPTLGELKRSLKNRSFDPIINELCFSIYPRYLGEIIQLEMKDKEFKVSVNPLDFFHIRKNIEFYSQKFSLEALFEIQFSDGSKQNVPIEISTTVDYPGVEYLPSNFIFMIANLEDIPGQFIILWNFNPKALKEEFRATTQKIQVKPPISTAFASNYSDFDITKLSYYRSSMEEVDYDFAREPIGTYRIRPSRFIGEYTLDIKGSVEIYSQRLTLEQVSSKDALNACLIDAYRRCLLKEEDLSLSPQLAGLSICPITK